MTEKPIPTHTFDITLDTSKYKRGEQLIADYLAMCAKKLSEARKIDSPEMCEGILLFSGLFAGILTKKQDRRQELAGIMLLMVMTRMLSVWNEDSSLPTTPSVKADFRAILNNALKRVDEMPLRGGA